MHYFKNAEVAYLEPNVFLHLEISDLQDVFISKTSSNLTGQQYTDAPASKTHVFLQRATCLSSTQLSRFI
jgi:hypothetical protein